jgi:hypothetical protein
MMIFVLAAPREIDLLGPGRLFDCQGAQLRLEMQRQ